MDSQESSVKNKKRKLNLKVYIWTQPLIKKLLEQYELYDCLYDTKNKFYTNKHARTDALSKICQSLQEIQPKITVEDVKQKINNIRSQVSHELQKIAESKRTGTGTDDMYEPTIWWFEYIEFLISHMKPRKGIDSLAFFEENNNEDSNIEAQRVTQDESDEDANDSSSNYTSDVINSSEPSTSYLNQRSIKRKEKRISKVTSQGVEFDQTNDIIHKTIETLSCLNNNISSNKASTGPCRENEFGALIAKELSEIDDVALLLEAKDEIDNVIYKYKKLWLQKQIQIEYNIQNE